MAANRVKALGANGKDQRLSEQAAELTQLLGEFSPGRWTDLPEEAKQQLMGLADTLGSCRETIARAPE